MQTIINNIPKEFKNPIKVRAGKIGAEKKKIILSKTVKGATSTEAENHSIASTEAELRRSKAAANIVNNDLDTSKPREWGSKSEDVRFLKRVLGKRAEENQQKDIEIEHLRRENEELSSVIKKDAFTTAANYKSQPSTKKFAFPEPDEINTFVWRNISFDNFRMKLGPLKAVSNTKINVYLERVLP